MSYPIVTQIVARIWYRNWMQACLAETPPRRVPVEDPETSSVALGEELDWGQTAAEVVGALTDLLRAEGAVAFESEGAILLHQSLPDHPALRDAEFWTWLATVPGRALILERYPQPKAVDDPAPEPDDEPTATRNPLPNAKNFHGSGARETLFYRLWIRAEMARNEDAEDPWELVRPGMVDFWRSHVFRQLYAHHRPFLFAFVDFQFPRDDHGQRGQPRLNTNDIRALARELSMNCANVVIEALDRDRCAALIRRVHAERVAGARS